MSLFIHTHKFSTTATYTSIPVGSYFAESGPVYTAGAIGNQALFSKFDDKGNIIWSKIYYIDKLPVGFSSSVRCDNGDFILYGSHNTDPSATSTDQRNHNLIIRTDSKGEVIWTKTYHQLGTRFNVKLIKSVDDTYYFTSWSNKIGSSVDSVELVKIDGQGNVLRAVLLGTETNDDQVSGMIPWGSGCLVFGNSNAGSNWDTFLIALDDQLNIVWSYLLGNKDYQTAEAVLQIGQDHFIVTGETGAERKTYVLRFDSSKKTAEGYLIPFRKETETGKKILTRGEKGFYLTMHMSEAPTFSAVAFFDTSIQMKWLRRFKLPKEYILNDLHYDFNSAASGLLMCGHTPLSGKGITALLAQTDTNYTSCLTESLPLPTIERLTFTVKQWEIKPEEIRIEEIKWDAFVVKADAVLTKYCPKGVPVDLGNNPSFQSPYIYLQAAGSDAADGSVRGFHLRWDFLRKLGETHWPKGNLASPSGAYPTNIGFNRPDDFVRIYKSNFRRDFGTEVNLSIAPTQVQEAGVVRTWLYDNVPNAAGTTTDILIRFVSNGLYDAVRQSFNPLVSPMQFMQAYTGQLEIRAVGKFVFWADFKLTAMTSGSAFRLESISLPDKLDVSTRLISSRKRHTTPPPVLIAENIEYFRLDYTGCTLSSFYLITYEDYIAGKNKQQEWNFFGEYAINDGNSDANAEVFRRLENPTDFIVHNKWPKFNQLNVAGEFCVNVQNYKDRWTMVDDGIQEAVETYLDKSRFDVKANVVIPNTDPDPNSSTTEISYLDMLNFAGLDYHVCRMLGMGTIDSQKTALQSEQVIYLMQYVTTASLETGPGVYTTHLFMSLPTSMNDYRYPPRPSLLTVSYGLTADNCGGQTALTDANGYVPYAAIRYINLHRNKFRYELPFENFFATNQSFNLGQETIPVLFGVEYADGPNGSGTYVRPEISHDVNWIDPGGLPEVRPIPETRQNPVYTHGETEEGVHHYALYSINWFSRSSAPGNEVETDATVFEKRNTLLPPSNLTVQLIQNEVPLIFTTQAEQNRLQALPSGDKTLVRAMFDWNQTHNIAYQYANKAQLFFRTAPPRVVNGKITSSSVDTINNTVDVHTGSYTTSNPLGTVQPVILAADVAAYIGSTLVVNGKAFVVESIVTAGNNPVIRLKRIRVTSSQDSLNDNVFCTTISWEDPDVNSNFLLVENLDAAAAWNTQLVKEVALTQFLPAHTEIETMGDGTVVTRYIGGLTDAATIAHVYDTDPTLAPFIPVGGPPANQIPTGLYRITFSTKQLVAYPDPDIEYYQGTVRLVANNGEIRELRVWNINYSLPTLEIIAFDSTFGLERDLAGMFVLTANQFTPLDPSAAIHIGSVPMVNFHPSYRAYFKADLGGGNNFGETAILPALNEGTRNTYMSIRSVDSTVVNCHSYMATPTVLLALEIREPEPPGVPDGALYATRPNFYGKSTYTFDVEVNQPFGLIFFRANERKILDQLYAPQRVKEIYEQLALLTEEDAAFETNRWNDLVNMITETDGQFKTYTPNGFRFPKPNNPNYQIPDPALTVPVFPFPLNNTVAPGSLAFVGGTTQTMRDVVRDAIQGAFLPLTETPAIYSQLKANSLQTSGRAAKIRNDNGDRLAPTDPAFDGWPMAIRYEKNAAGTILLNTHVGYGDLANKRYVRFTDYTLDGSSKNLYFYFGVEVSNSMRVSEASTATGPVHLVPTLPAESPSIKRVMTQIKNSITSTPTAVVFELNDYLETEDIVSFELYRASDPDDALSIRTMKLVKTIAVGEKLQDDFGDLSFPPYSDPLFYRIAALRKITNERGLTELVPSKPTDMVMATVLDTANPQAPKLSYASDPASGSPLSLSNVVISWSPTCYKGDYVLSKMTPAGNWQRIHQLKSNASTISVVLNLASIPFVALDKQDTAGGLLYHQFKVDVINTSGLVNRDEQILVI